VNKIFFTTTGKDQWESHHLYIGGSGGHSKSLENKAQKKKSALPNSGNKIARSKTIPRLSKTQINNYQEV